MDIAIEKAVGVWNRYLANFPEKRIDKAFLTNNVDIVKAVVGAIVPDLMEKSLCLEDELQEAETYIATLTSAKFAEFCEIAAFIPVTATALDTYADLERVNMAMLNLDLNFQFIINDPPKEHVIAKLDMSGNVPEDVEEVPEECVVVTAETGDYIVRVGERMVRPLWLVAAKLPSGAVSPIIVMHQMYAQMNTDKLVVTDTLEENVMFKKLEAKMSPDKSAVDALFDELGIVEGSDNGR